MFNEKVSEEKLKQTRVDDIKVEVDLNHHETAKIVTPTTQSKVKKTKAKKDKVIATDEIKVEVE